MLGNAIHHVYIADGFMDDVEELIQRCLQRQDVLDFKSFCIEWKKMDLGCMYKGRIAGAEIAELSEEVLHVAKHYMLADTSNYEESVAGLFIVYSLLNLQPYPRFAALRLIPEDVAAISRLEAVARRERRHDVLYILASVLIKGPCHFHAVERERGMEAPIRKYLEGVRSIDNIRGVQPKGVFFRQNEELDIIRELGHLTKRYAEAKAAVIGPGPSDRSLQYIDDNLPLDLNSSLRKIISGTFEEEEDDNDNVFVNESDSYEVSEIDAEEDHHALVESIKSRAMRDAVNPMKHLVGVEDRKRNAKKNQSTTSDIKSRPGKMRTSSPTKSHGSSQKRRPSPKGSQNKKTKTNSQSNSSNNNINTRDNDQVEGQTQYTQVTSVENTTMQNSLNIEIDCVPSLISTNDKGQIIQIQIIDEHGKQVAEDTTVDVIPLSGLPDLGCTDQLNHVEIVESVEPAQPGPSTSASNLNLALDPKRPRVLKKTHLKSKFKRMGMLPMANFEDENM